MTLSLNQTKTDTKKDTASSIMLNKYLKEAVALTENSTFWGARKKAADLAKKDEFQSIDKEDIKAKQKEIKAGLKNYGLMDKMAYYGDVKADTKELIAKVAAVGVIAGVAGAVVSPEAGQALSVAGLAYVTAKTMAYDVGNPETAKQKESVDNYIDLKHAQIALKKLSSHMEKQELKQMKQDAITKGLLVGVHGRGMMY